jgi:hypothetical protein
MELGTIEAAQKVLSAVETDLRVPNTLEHPPQAAADSRNTPSQNMEQRNNQKGAKHSARQAAEGVCKQSQPMSAYRDSESSHRLSFLLQAAHLTRGTSPALCRCFACSNNPIFEIYI